MAGTPSSSSALGAGASLFVLQLGSRLFSFALNQLLLRSTAPQAFGIATIQLDTLMATVLFLVREGIRGAVVRTRRGENADAAVLQQQTLLLPTLFSPLAALAFFLYSRFVVPTPHPAYYSTTLALYGLSTLAELVFEPLYLRTLQDWQTFTSKRVKVEGFAMLTKATGTLVTVRIVSEDEALLGYGIGQLVYSLTIWAGFAWILRSSTLTQSPSLSLRKVYGRFFDQGITELGWVLTKQSVVKQLLTEADKLAIGRFGSTADMGGYAVALNYGSLVARLLFQPLEESSRLYFSSLASTTVHDSASPEAASSSAESTPKPAGPPLSALASAASYLRLLLLFYTHLTLIFIFFAPAYTTPLLHLLLGPRWSRTSASPILRTYALSLPFLAFNGLTEAFFQSVAPAHWIQRGAAWMVICAAGFAVSVWVTIGRWGMGAEGLVVANCVNMAMRMAFSTVFMVRYFGDALRQDEKGKTGEAEGEEPGQGRQKERRRTADNLDWRAWTPSFATVVVFVVGGIVCRRSEDVWTEQVMLGQSVGGRKGDLLETGKHFAVGAVAGLIGLATIFVSHRTEIRQALATQRDRRKAE
ncbi:Oligosaccharide translocation protein RFT1 [Rhodotorula toruloides]|nr:Oligosaccharide translocation protein RFT1 [Rhodotorula toruloides]